MNTLLRKPFFWIALTGLCIASIAFSCKYYSYGLPFVSINLEMNREQALEKAQSLATAHTWDPTHHRSAIAFENNTEAQYFIELEGGGKEAFNAMIKTHAYEPYSWHVRFFQEKVTQETHVYFTPQGTPYKFELKLPEALELPNLSVEKARTLARDEASHHWNIQFNEYTEVETSATTTPQGRVDHTFVYQKHTPTIGTEGRYRLQLVVSGNKVTEVSPFIFIPDSFKRRYAEMRSSNTLISTSGAIGMFFLYLFLGCLLGGAFLLRKKLLIFKPALYWAFGIALLLCLHMLNQLPQIWMRYDTAHSCLSFLMIYFFQVFAGSCFTFLFLLCCFSSPVTWDFLAFKNHLFFWKLWSPTVGGSKEVFHQTLLGYAYAVIFLGMAIATYILFFTHFGWWSPSDTLIDPNILATYVPWLSSFFSALQAGVMEEVVFRALPLATAALIGRYLNKEKTCITLGFILQIFIFAACHADYPQQPGYCRLVELIIPSTIFGGLYLWLGLLPGIIAHFIYDFFLMSLPILVSHAPHAFIHKLIIAFIAAIPLLILLYRRYRLGQWYTVQPEDYNRGWQQTASATQEEQLPTPAHNKEVSLSKRTHYIVYTLGFLGLLSFILYSNHQRVYPSLDTSKKEALMVAQPVFEKEHLYQDMQWTQLTGLRTNSSLEEQFVWQKNSKESFKSLIGSYITPPSWTIRYVSFSGDIIKRAQELSITVGQHKEILTTNLTLPENEPGESLSQKEAGEIALRAIEQQLGTSSSVLKEISAVAQSKPARKDWTFIFHDNSISLRDGGQARITVTLLGDRIGTISRSIFVPESYQREIGQEAVYRSLVNIAALFCFLFLLIYGLIFLRKEFFHSFCMRSIGCWFVCLTSIAFLNMANTSCQTVAYFSTSQSYLSQLIALYGMSCVFVIIFNFLFAVYASQIKNLIGAITTNTRSVALLGISSQLIVSGITSLFLYCAPSYTATLSPSSMLCLNTLYSTILTLLCTDGIVSCILTACTMLSVVVLINGITNHWTQRKVLGTFFLFLFGFSKMASLSSQLFINTAVLYGCLMGLIMIALYIFILRYDKTTIIIMATTQIALSLIQFGFLNLYSGAIFDSIIATFCILIFGYWWFLHLRKGTLVCSKNI